MTAEFLQVEGVAPGLLDDVSDLRFRCFGHRRMHQLERGTAPQRRQNDSLLLGEGPPAILRLRSAQAEQDQGHFRMCTQCAVEPSYTCDVCPMQVVDDDERRRE